MISINCHSSIRIEGKDAVIYVDPFHIAEEKHDADLVLTTHDHFDHLSPEDIEKVKNDNTIVKQLKPGETLEVKGVKVKAYPAYNEKKQFHPKENNWVGYMLMVDGNNIYVTGDSDAQIKLDEPVDILCIPVGGTYTFDAEEAAAYTNMLMPKTAIPTHYGEIVGEKNSGEKFRELVDDRIQVEIKIK